MAARKPEATMSEPAYAAVLHNTESGAIGRRELPKLRELGAAREILDQWLAETEGEETPELADLFEKLEGEVREKVERWGLYLIDRNTQEAFMRAEADFYAAEAKRLKERADSFAAGTARSTKQLQFQMELQGIDKVEGVYCTVRLQRNPPKCIGEVDAETLQTWYLDERLQGFVRYVPESFALDRAAVLTAAKNHTIEQLPGGLQVVAEQRVVVK